MFYKFKTSRKTTQENCRFQALGVKLNPMREIKRDFEIARFD